VRPNSHRNTKRKLDVPVTARSRVAMASLHPLQGESHLHSLPPNSLRPLPREPSAAAGLGMCRCLVGSLDQRLVIRPAYAFGPGLHRRSLFPLVKSNMLRILDVGSSVAICCRTRSRQARASSPLMAAKELWHLRCYGSEEGNPPLHRPRVLTDQRAFTARRTCSAP